MRVALCEMTGQITIDVTDAEYKGLLGFLGSHRQFGFTPDSVQAAWVENPTRVTRDVFQFVYDQATDDYTSFMVSMSMLFLCAMGIQPSFVITRVKQRPFLGLLPGVPMETFAHDHCPSRTRVESMLIMSGFVLI